MAIVCGTDFSPASIAACEVAALIAAAHGEPLVLVHAVASRFGTVRNPVRMMMLEHDRVSEFLARLRATTGGYTAPFDAGFSYRELYRCLAEFELRTHEHVHAENNLYYPRAVELEDGAV